ncbi:hypothetical protein Hanom_Chr12g01089971 [Helianthus anomalus]
MDHRSFHYLSPNNYSFPPPISVGFHAYCCQITSLFACYHLTFIVCSTLKFLCLLV